MQTSISSVCKVWEEQEQGQSEQVQPIYLWVLRMNHTRASPILQLSRKAHSDRTALMHILY